MSRLATYQALWATEDLPWRVPADEKWNLPQRFQQIATAGFDGVVIDLATGEVPDAQTAVRLLADNGLRSVVLDFPTSDDLSCGLDYAGTVGADFVVVCGDVHPLSPAEAAPIVQAWLDAAAAAGIPVQLETHRGTLTNDLSFTAELIDMVPEVDLSADLSHYVVANELVALELPLPGRERIESLLARVVGRATSFQGRVATPSQIQVPLNFPQHQAWVDRFRGWWAEGFARWRTRTAADPEAECAFLCELGAWHYPITGEDGEELSDRWQEAQLMRRWAIELFAAADPVVVVPATAGTPS